MTLEQMQERAKDISHWIDCAYTQTEESEDITFDEMVSKLNSLITEVWNEAVKECEGCVPEEKIISKIKAGCMREGVRGQKRHQAVTRAYGHNSCREQTLQAIRQMYE